MDANYYQKLAMRTESSNVTDENRMVNAALGLAGESGELADMVKKHKFQGHEFDVVAAKKELGDVLWYAAQMATALGISLGEVLAMNIQKLQERFPGGFTESASTNRAEYDKLRREGAGIRNASVIERSIALQQEPTEDTEEPSGSNVPFVALFLLLLILAIALMGMGIRSVWAQPAAVSIVVAPGTITWSPATDLATVFVVRHHQGEAPRILCDYTQPQPATYVCTDLQATKGTFYYLSTKTSNGEVQLYGPYAIPVATVWMPLTSIP
jgi:NTP pyrophosphatase (non-canonical NTP hydrolase)/Na+-transporting methylmalonyl-CoA/oxaloacetate decarboxylase gamma subunit